MTPRSGYSLSETLAIGFIQQGASCSDGSPVTDIDVSAGETVTCTFVNQRGYVRPKGASPHKTPLVPAYNACTSPNRVHGPSLEHPSCNPPALSSPRLTTGTPDVNGAVANMNASVSFRVFAGDPGTPEDEADVNVQAIINDVRLRTDATDYTGELQGEVVLQVTDKTSTAALSDATTMSGVPLRYHDPVHGHREHHDRRQLRRSIRPSTPCCPVRSPSPGARSGSWATSACWTAAPTTRRRPRTTRSTCARAS